MKLYLDEHISPLLAAILLERGIDCLTARDAGMLGDSDDAQLRYATAHRRVLVTFNRKDFLALASQWAENGRAHAGLIVSKQAAVPELLRLVLHVVTRHRQDDLTNHILWLQNYKEPRLP